MGLESDDPNIPRSMWVVRENECLGIRRIHGKHQRHVDTAAELELGVDDRDIGLGRDGESQRRSRIAGSDDSGISVLDRANRRADCAMSAADLLRANSTSQASSSERCQLATARSRRSCRS